VRRNGASKGESTNAEGINSHWPRPLPAKCKRRKRRGKGVMRSNPNNGAMESREKKKDEQNTRHPNRGLVW